MRGLNRSHTAALGTLAGPESRPRTGRPTLGCSRLISTRQQWDGCGEDLYVLKQSTTAIEQLLSLFTRQLAVEGQPQVLEPATGTLRARELHCFVCSVIKLAGLGTDGRLPADGGAGHGSWRGCTEDAPAAGKSPGAMGLGPAWEPCMGLARCMCLRTRIWTCRDVF